MSTLLGFDDQPGEIPGLGPVLAQVARDLVTAQHRGAQWRFAVTDVSGYLILAGTTRRRPALDAAGPCRGGVVEIHLPAVLLDQLTTNPALPGRWAAVIADIAAQYARRDELTAALDRHPAGRFAHAALARHVQVRDRTCSHPGCRRPTRKSALDHTRDHARGGPTTTDNSGPGCNRHHLVYKHEFGWQLRQPEPGHFEWRSPLGRTYRTRGEPISPPLPDPAPRTREPDPAQGPHTNDNQPKILRPPPPRPNPNHRHPRLRSTTIRRRSEPRPAGDSRAYLPDTNQPDTVVGGCG